MNTSDSEENQTLGDSFSEGTPQSPSSHNESTISNQDDEHAVFMQTIQADFMDVDAAEPIETSQSLRCNVYVSTQPIKEEKGRVRFSFHGSNHPSPSPSSNVSDGQQNTPRSPLKLKSILYNGSEDIPTARCVVLDGPKQHGERLDETTFNLGSAVKQLTFGDDVMDVFEGSQNDMHQMVKGIVTETEQSIATCRSFTRQLSDVGGDLMQKVCTDSGVLSTGFAGSVPTRACNIEQPNEVVADHWQKGSFKTGNATTKERKDSAEASTHPISQNISSPTQEDQCHQSTCMIELINSISIMATKFTKKVQDVANSCHEKGPFVELTPADKDRASTSETPLNQSWFSVDRDTDSISKLTNPQDLSATLNNISLDLTAIPRVDENEQLCEF